MNVSGQNDWKMVKHIRKVVSDGGLESLATFKNAGGQQEQDNNPFSRSFHALGRTLFLSLAESGKSIPVDFCLSLLDQIIKQGINHNNNSIEHIIQERSDFSDPNHTVSKHFRTVLDFFLPMLNSKKYLPWLLLNHLLQISGVESRVPAVLIASIDPQIPMLRKEISTMIALSEKRNFD